MYVVQLGCIGIRNEYIRERLGVTDIAGTMRENRLEK